MSEFDSSINFAGGVIRRHADGYGFFRKKENVLNPVLTEKSISKLKQKVKRAAAAIRAGAAVLL